MLINVEIGVEDTEGDVWKLEVDSDGDVRITTPCGEEVDFRAGKKGKFFSDMQKAYKKAATTAGIFDTEKENVTEEQKKVDAPCPDECGNDADCDGGCGYCGLCCECDLNEEEEY